jgi:hypothetical protein
VPVPEGWDDETAINLPPTGWKFKPTSVLVLMYEDADARGDDELAEAINHELYERDAGTTLG